MGIVTKQLEVAVVFIALVHVSACETVIKNAFIDIVQVDLDVIKEP